MLLEFEMVLWADSAYSLFDISLDGVKSLSSSFVIISSKLVYLFSWRRDQCQKIKIMRVFFPIHVYLFGLVLYPLFLLEYEL